MSELKRNALEYKWAAKDGVITTHFKSDVPALIMAMTFSNQEVAQHIVDIHNKSLKNPKDVRNENKRLKQHIDDMWKAFGNFCKVMNELNPPKK